MGMVVIKPGGDVLKDSLVIKNMEIVGGMSMSARLVMIPQRVGRSRHSPNEAEISQRGLQDQECGLGGPEHPHLLWLHRAGQEGEEENPGEGDSVSWQRYRERLGPSTGVGVGGK